MARSVRHGWVPQIFRPQSTRSQTLYHHFFRRFFDNDTISLDGETETTVIRALSGAAVPGLMVAFWLLPHYPNRNLWATAADRYFFVLFSFVVMGAVTTFEWEMLFPDRADFLILLPLGLKSGELFLAKAKALLAFLGMFLVAVNIFPLILYSAVSTRSSGNVAYTVLSHFAATMLSGIFAAFAMLALQGLTVCLLPPAWFRTVSTLLQSLSITALLLLFLLFPLCGSHMQTLLEGRSSFATWIPTLWFLGLYEHLSGTGSSTAPAASQTLANCGLIATAIAASVAILTYPLAWARQRKRAMEGSPSSGAQPRNFLAAVLQRTLLKQPQHRAIFHFISQTIARNTRYQVYLALYAGVGLALALCTIVTVHQSPGHILTPALWQPGLHALLPLLLFWMVSGLGAAFSFPVDMRARWVFPINLKLTPNQPESERETGPNPYAFPGPAAKSAKLFTFLCSITLTAAILAILLALHWSYLNLLIQAIYGCGLSLVFADLFFLGRTQIPFTRPRLPGRTNLAIVFTLYAVLFPTLTLFTVMWELQTERRPILILWTLIAIAALHLVLKTIDKLATEGIIGGFPEDESDPGPQTLNLFQ